MAKQETPVKIDKTPEQALGNDWPEKLVDGKKISCYVTQTGGMRGGLRPSEQKIARQILSSYGF